MRIALAAEGTRGDIHPLLALGVQLLREGHQVVLCAPPDFREVAASCGLEFAPVGCSVRAYLSEQAEAVTRGGLRMLRESHRYLEQCIAAQFAALPDAAAGADHLIGGGVQFAAPSVAERLGIPYRYVVYCPALLPSREHAPAMLPWPNLPRPLYGAAWRMLLAFYQRLFARQLDPARARLCLPPVGDVYRHILSPRPLLAVDRELAVVPPDCPIEVEQIPCLHPLDGAELPAKLQSFLAQGPAPIFLGFGSMPDPAPAATTRKVLRALDTLGCRALLSRGWAELGEGALPEGVCLVDDVSHARLFPHVAAVVHHGGAGTTSSAARAGVPQLVVPHIADQFYWGRRVAELGLGPPPLPRTRLTAGSLAERLAQVLDNELLCERASELGAQLRARAERELPALPRQLLR